MTEQELQAIEARLAQEPPNTAVEILYHARQDIPALVAEVRRLRGLIEAAEWLGPVIEQRASCPWCLMRQPRGHADNCPAFPPT